MARPASITRASLDPLIQARGPISATDLAAALRVNRTSITRALAGFGDELVTVGATRATRYMLRRSVRQAGTRWPIYRINEDGQASEWAYLEALHDRRWRLIWCGSTPAWAEWFTDKHGLWSGFPFFLGDVRPSGFIGRITAKEIGGLLGVPDDPRSWSDEDTLVYLQARGIDVPGNIVVGDEALRQALNRVATLSAEEIPFDLDRSRRYPECALAVSRTLPGSSAGGEQPKFLTMLRSTDDEVRPVLVKFTPPTDQMAARRWSDLLLCEWHAQEILAANPPGLALSEAAVLDLGGRRFLEVPRFDRIGGVGRRGVLTLEALAHAALDSHQPRWTGAIAELAKIGFVAADTQADVVRLQAFGELIGNTDMHLGNLAFWLDDQLPFRIAPAYDMLPMLWAPTPQGEIVKRVFAPSSPIPSSLSAWAEASVWAIAFWEQVLADPRLSSDFVVIGSEALAIVKRLRDHVLGR
jgi:hypothetical protein